jgi:chorismate--pyruvate lyase
VTINSVLFSRKPSWHRNRKGLRYPFSKNAQSWVYESGSITKRIRALYGKNVAVSILLQKWCLPWLSERKALSLSEHRWCLCREVLIHGNDKPLVLARTIIPASTLKIAHQLSHLGSRPLGEVIFSYPDLQKLRLDVTTVKPSDWRQNILDTVNIEQSVTGRRSVYAIDNQQLLVSEFFLPEVLS